MVELAKTKSQTLWQA